MKITTLLASLACLAVGSATSILLPLYIYPTDGAWTPVYDAISAHPGVTFNVIVNPDSGPGSGTYPSSDYITAVANLNKYPNVHLIGYVPTGRTSRPYNELTANITKYANWKTHTPANITLSGIFFDEATTSTAPAAETYMSNAATFTRAHFPAGPPPVVVLNPGTLTDASYFRIADAIVEFEDAYAVYNPSATPAGIPPADRAKSVILIHDTPSDADVAGVVQTAAADGIGGIYLSSDCCWNAVEIVGQVADAVADAAG